MPSFEKQLETFVLELIDKQFQKDYPNGDVPFEIFGTVVLDISWALAFTLHKNICSLACFMNDPEFGKIFFTKLLENYNFEVENFEKLQEQLAESVVTETKKITVH
jgi:hypothetical protein